MFNIGDTIVYGAQGICKIDGFETKQIGKDAFKYYVLKPIFNESATVFVPVNNQTLVAKMQEVLTKPQAEELICKVSQISPIDLKNENDKREQYKTILSSGNREMLVALIKTIRSEQESRRSCGKKLNLNDEQTLRKAEHLLLNELSFVLGITFDEALNKIIF